MVSVETARMLMDEADRYGLSGADFLRSLPEEEVAREFNGIGPEWFPDKVRKALDSAFKLFLPCAAIHDLRYRHGNGTYGDFRNANRELGDNCVKVAESDFGWYDPRRYKFRDAGRKLETVCDVFGWTAYSAACSSQKEKPK